MNQLSYEISLSQVIIKLYKELCPEYEL